MKKNSAVLGAAFLMATSAIGPGFLTQTAQFTADLTTSFGFIILISLLLDIGVQLNIWRVIGVSKLPAQQLADRLLPGMGTVLAIIVAFGGLIFNIGNIAGCALGLNALTGLDTLAATVISCLIALGIFWYKEAGTIIDNFSKVLGLLMIGLTVYIAFVSRPPVLLALHHTFLPEKVDVFKIVTLVGGTVGGYISFAGAHRLLEAGVSGSRYLPKIDKSAVSGIIITSVMRFVLFFAVLGVVWHGGKLGDKNPAATVFSLAAGATGLRFFGLVMWSAAITSVIGASYTSVSFLRTFSPVMEKYRGLITSLFIVCSSVIFLFLGNPVSLLLLAGAFNGLILPLALAVILVAAVKPVIVGHYRHPLWLLIAGWIIVFAVLYMGISGFFQNMDRLFS